MNKLENKNVLITGASRGIGAAIARLFAKEGARLVINCNRSVVEAGAIADKIKRETGTEVFVFAADIGNKEEAIALVDDAQHVLGYIDILVNNAGVDILTEKRGHGLSRDEKLQKLLAVDLCGTMYMSWAVLPVMRERGQGVILNMAWDLATHGFAGENPQLFAAVKAGVLGFSRAFAKTVAPRIRVNVLAPGWIQTDFASEDMSREYYQARLAEIPQGRFGEPADVAAAALFLASDEAAYITGQLLKINGGLC